jgi:hypothetical protein
METIRSEVQEMNWFVRLFLTKYNNGDFDTKRVTAPVITPASSRPSVAVNDAMFQAQSFHPDYEVHLVGASSPDMSPYPCDWKESGMA